MSNDFRNIKTTWILSNRVQKLSESTGTCLVQPFIHFESFGWWLCFRNSSNSVSEFPALLYCSSLISNLHKLSGFFIQYNEHVNKTSINKVVDLYIFHILASVFSLYHASHCIHYWKLWMAMSPSSQPFKRKKSVCHVVVAEGEYVNNDDWALFPKMD